MQFKEYHTRRPKQPSEDNLRYIMQIKGVLENTEDPEERITLISNVNEELRGMEVSLATDKKASFVIEKIIKYSSRNQLRLFLSYCKGFTIHMFTQRYASHVMQTALEQASYFLKDKESEDEIIQGPTGESIDTLVNIISSIVHEMSKSFNELICDACSTHVVRILLCIICGYPCNYCKTKKHLKKGKTSINEKHTFPSEFEGCLLQLSGELNKLSIEDMEAVLTNQYGSPVIQLLLSILPASSSLSLALSILQITDEDPELSYAIAIYKNMIKNTIGARTLEALTPFLPNKIIIVIYKGLLPSLNEYIEDRNANYVIQQFFACIYEKDLIRQTYEQVSSKIEELYKTKNGVVLNLFNACRRNEVYDEEMSTLLKPLLLKDCSIIYEQNITDPIVSQIKDITEDGLFIMTILGMKENGGKILLNDKTCSYFYEYIQLRSTLSANYVLTISKLDIIQLLRLCIYLRGDIIYTALDKYLKEKEDRKQFVAFIKEFNFEDSPILRSKINNKEEKNFKNLLKKIRTEIKHSLNIQKYKSKHSTKRSHSTDDSEIIKRNKKSEKREENNPVEETQENKDETMTNEINIETKPIEEKNSISNLIEEVDKEKISINQSNPEPSNNTYKVPSIISKLGFRVKN